jgi:hypothetical protein
LMLKPMMKRFCHAKKAVFINAQEGGLKIAAY